MTKNKHVVPHGDGWAVKTAGNATPDSIHRTQSAAERAAKAALRQLGGEVRIHRPDGTIRDSDTIAPGRDPRLPADTRH